MTTTTIRAPRMTGYAALGVYALAGVLFGVGVARDWDRLRDFALALGLLGLAVDMRHHTARAIYRMVYSMSLWQDYDGPLPLHRRERPLMEEDDSSP